MQARFYYNKSDKIVVYKQLVDKFNASKLIYYKEDTDLVNPTFIMDSDKRMDNDINYVYVQDVGRYYYVNDITYSQGRIELHCTVDVLMSFKSEIDKQKVIIERSETDYNLYLSDNHLRSESQSRVLTFHSEYGFDVSGNKPASWILTLNGGGATE